MPHTLRYIGYTKTYAEKQSAVQIARAARTHLEWPGFEFAPNYFIEFRFRVPESELRELASGDDDEVVWLDAPDRGKASEVTIVSGPSTHTGPPPQRDDSGKIELLATRLMEKNARMVWVIHHHIPAPPRDFWIHSRTELLDKLRENNYQIDPVITPSTLSLSATMDCGDGSAAEVELSPALLAGTVQ